MTHTMHNGYCPKCGAGNVRKPRFATGMNTPAGDVYICLSCGYTEGYTSATELTRIAGSADWEQVGPKLPSAPAPQAATGATVRLNAADANAGTLQPKRRCPACGSSEIVADARVLDTGQGAWGSLMIQVERSPNALLMRGAVRSVVRAYVCAECGYTSLYADSPHSLAEADREARSGKP